MTMMTAKRHIKIFSAGCPICDEAIQTVNELTCSSCEIEILDMHDPAVTARAASLLIRSIPAVVIDEQLAACCTRGGISRDTLRLAGVGTPL